MDNGEKENLPRRECSQVTVKILQAEGDLERHQQHEEHLAQTGLWSRPGVNLWTERSNQINMML